MAVHTCARLQDCTVIRLTCKHWPLHWLDGDDDDVMVIIIIIIMKHF